MILRFIKESPFCVKCSKKLTDKTGKYELPEASGLRGNFFCCRNCKSYFEEQYEEDLEESTEKKSILPTTVKIIKESSRCELCGNRFGAIHIKYVAPPSLHLKDGQYICEICHAKFKDEYHANIDRAKQGLLKAILDF